MDENLLLLDFRLLVDRATEILGKLSAQRQIEAVNDGLASVKRKLPDLYEHVRRELSSSDESRKQCGTAMVKKEDAHMWNNGPSSTVANDGHSKADLNQNFEKIMCKEEVKFDDDDFDDTVPASNGSAMRLLNNLDDRNTGLVPSVRGISHPDVRSSNLSSFPATTSTSMFAISKFGQTSERCKLLSGKLQSLLHGHFSNHLPWKCNVQKFRFYTHDFFMQFLRRDEDLNRNAFRQQILAALEFAVDHRKPFLRNFLLKLVLSGVIIPGVRPPPRFIEGSSTQSRELERPTSPPVNQPLLSSSNNGSVKDFMELDESSVTEETTQNTDSSEENGRNGTASPTNSIQTETQKEKDNEVSSQNARKPKDKLTYECLLCPKTYRKRKSLIDHYKTHPGYCHDCGQRSGTELKEIIEHNRSYHAEDFPFICELCGESYSRRQQFHAHVESHNKKDVKSYSCGECGMEFPRMKLHRQHLEETGHKPDGAICEVCGAGFNSKIALCQHMNRVHKKDNCFECHICQNRFTMKANLERHVQLHTEVKRTYVCDQCGSSYFTYPALREHFSNAHTDASECKCTLCGKTFSSVKSLQRHLPSHSEERPHMCNVCSQTFKWKTHLVRHKQAMHGNQPTPKKLKRFAKCDEELVPVDITPPTKQSRKSTPKPKASSSSATTPKSSAGASTKSKTPSTPSSTPTTPQLESQNNFTFPSAEKHVSPSNRNAKKSNLIDMNNFNAGAAENYRFETNKGFATAQQITIKQEPQQLVAFEGRYQQGSPRPHPQQQQQIHAQASQHQHMHQSPSHHQPAPHHQQAQVLHHQQQHLHQHQPSQQLHQAAHHHHAQQQHISNQIIHSQQPPYHQQPQSRMQSPRRHMQSPQGIMQSPQHHMQSPQPHIQQQPQGHMRHPQAQPHHHPQQPHHHQQQQHMQQQQPPHLQHPQSHHQQPSHLPPHQPAPHIPQPQPQAPQNHHAAQQMQYSSDWENMNFNAASASTKEKYFPMIEVSSNDFMGLPMAEMPKNEQQPPQQTMDTTELLGFQNMWPGNNQQLNFNNGNIETNTYSNIGSILTNLELIGNNSPLDFNNYDIMSEHQMGTQQLQHHAYLHQDIDPNSGNMNHPVINYDYSSQNHTITDLSNTIQDQKSDFQYHHPRSNYDHSIVSGSGGGGSGNSGVYNQNENDKVILPPITDYMHQASLQQQQQQQQQQHQQQQQQQQQQPSDVNIVYYPVKN